MVKPGNAFEHINSQTGERHLDAEEEEDPLVVHVVDLLVPPDVERSQAGVGSFQQLLRIAKPEHNIQFITFPRRDKPSYKLLFTITQVLQVPHHRLVDVLQRVRPRPPAVVGHHSFWKVLSSHVAGHWVPKELIGSEQA